jgi:glycosyltransferase involved in cell wall biosynthesis
LPLSPHGINPGFRITNRLHRNIADCNKTQPFTILYVSRIEPYKNQLTVIDLVAAIRDVTGWPIRLVLLYSVWQKLTLYFSWGMMIPSSLKH